MAKHHLRVLALAVCAACAACAALAAPAGAQPNVAAGRPVSLLAGTVNGVALSTLTDGNFVPDAQQWQTGSVWWNGTTPQLFIDLGGVFDLTGLISQVDNNDTYRIEFRDPVSGLFGNPFDFSPPNLGGNRTWPNPANNSQIGSLGGTIRANAIRFSAVSGDNSYSVTEIQLYGTAVSAVPEPATVALLGVGLVGMGAVARRRRRA